MAEAKGTQTPRRVRSTAAGKDSPSVNGSARSRTDRDPPHDFAAERNLLGGALIDAGPLEVVARMRAEDFYRPGHQQVAHVLARAHAEGWTPDPTTVASELERAGILEQIGGRALLAELVTSTPSTSAAPRYAQIVQDCAARRRFLGVAGELAELAHTADSAHDLAARTRTALELAAPADGGRLERLVLTGDEIETIPRPELLLDGILNRKSLAVLFGKPGGGKSFLALDWAASIAAGSWWMKREIHAGPVLYVAAEGAEGLGMRLRAWKTARNVLDVSRLDWLPSTVNLFDPAEVAELVALAKRRPYALVVIDTLARCIVGADENSAKDMGIVIDALERIRAASNATVLVVHHTPRGGENARGSTALEGAVDTMIKVKGEEGRLVVECEKQKNAAKFLPLHLRLDSVGDSAVLTRTSGDPADDERMTARCVELLRLLESMDSGHGIAAKAWEDAASEEHGIARTSFYRVRKILTDRELVEQTGDNQRAPWRLTEKGEQTIAPLEGDR